MQADCLPILVYHGVISATDTPAERFTVSLDSFTEHMDALAASPRVALRISELSAPLARGEPMSASAA
ncbi:MAG: hypothetical protein QOD24_4800, partial [Solirubrobacteraceae bacterium]|nr:hypothetical protein [Solirubrobacteraceae bacterium]